MKLSFCLWPHVCPCCVNTWGDAEVDVVPPHARRRVGDGRHVGGELHGTQRVLRAAAAVHGPVMVQVALKAKTDKSE